jgi:hypothetical protein
MTFWSTNNVEPTRQFRFKVETGEGVLWWAKTVSKPSFSISEQQYQVANHKFKYPGIVTWNDVTLHIVDTGAKTMELYSGLIDSGYKTPDGLGASEGVSKKALTKEVFGGHFHIHQLNGEGETIEEWILHNPKVTAVNFGSLDYSSDELVSIEIIVSYDWAELSEAIQAPLDSHLPF